MRDACPTALADNKSSTLIIIDTQPRPTILIIFKPTANREKCLIISVFMTFLKNQQGLAAEDPHEARKELENIQGHLVNMPLKFLQHSDLRPPSGSKEALVPAKVFT